MSKILGLFILFLYISVFFSVLLKYIVITQLRVKMLHWVTVLTVHRFRVLRVQVRVGVSGSVDWHGVRMCCVLCGTHMGGFNQTLVSGS